MVTTVGNDDFLARFKARRMKEIVKTLEEARDLISQPEKWTKGAMVRGGFGTSTQYCAVGAIRRVSFHGESEWMPTFSDAYYYLRRALPDWYRSRRQSVEEYNDAKLRKHKDIMALYDKAIELAKAEMVAA